MFNFSQRKFRWGQKVLITATLILISEFYLPHYLLAAQTEEELINKGPVLEFIKHNPNSFNFYHQDIQKFISTYQVRPKSVKYIRVTGYSSTPDQTDSTPFITANGKTVYDGLVASNCLPFGARIQLPDYFGDKEFTVSDRMNQRYDCAADIWFTDRLQAIEFGVRYLKMEVY